MTDNAVMGAKKKTPDRHKPARMVRIRGQLAGPLQEVAELNATDFTTEVNRAVKELLQREGLWPNKPSAQDNGDGNGQH